MLGSNEIGCGESVDGIGSKIIRDRTLRQSRSQGESMSDSQSKQSNVAV